MTPALALLLGGLLAAPSPPDAAAPDLRTTFETSEGLRTGRYEEVERLCPAFEAAYPGRARCFRFGTTPESRPMLALAVSGDGVLDPAAARARKRPVVLFQGGIHAGEIDGKDAGFQVLRRLLDGIAGGDEEREALAGALERLVLVFVPVFNVDGHERFGPHNRPNQRGPEEMGWRVTAQNLNLNRDYLKADAPEMRALVGLLNDWDPAVYADLHVTDGARFRHDVAVLVSPRAGAGTLGEAAAKLRAGIGDWLRARDHLPIMEFYPAFVKDDDPTSGFAVGEPPPRFSTSYWAARNRLAVLVETHSWKEYAVRVRATADTLLALIAAASRDGASWLAREHALDEKDRELGGKEVALDWMNGPRTRTIDFAGYAYRIEKSDVSGASWIRYDETRPEVWKVPLKDSLVESLVVRAPRKGYLVPPAWAPVVAERLAVHGIEFGTLAEAKAGRGVWTWRATKAEPASTSYEGHQRMKLEGSWAEQAREVPKGTLYVPIAQPRARLVLHLLEPQAPDSLAGWGFFNAAFERKEYLESYVAEELARDMLARDPELEAEFAKRLADDKAFAADPKARLDFFYRRSPWWDERMGLYPVYRLEE